MRRTICLALIVMLSACAADHKNYPSLARRPVERVTGTLEVPDPTPPPPLTEATPDPALEARLAAIHQQAQAGHTRFESRRGPAEARVAAASGAPVAGEAWAVATVALADLESVRSDVMIALADVDAIDAELQVALKSSTATSALRDDITKIVAQEDAVLASLRGRMKG